MWAGDFIQAMREQGAVHNPPSPQMAIMTGKDSCKLGGLELSKEDLFFCERLLHPCATKVAGDCKDGSPLQDKSTYLAPLKAGDRVLIWQMPGVDGTATAYVVVGRLVRS